MENKNDDVIELNVGGQAMATKRSTLCQVEGSLLSSMFSGRWEDNMIRDKDGRIFLDFNPKYFGFILDCLRAKAISVTGKPAKLPKVDSNEVDNFHELIEYLGLSRDLLPQVTAESFNEHSPGIKLEENATVAAYLSKTLTDRRRPNRVLGYSQPTNEFVFGEKNYEEGIIRLKLKMEWELYERSGRGCIWVGMVPTEFTYEFADRATAKLGENFYGWQMGLSCDQGIEINCENGVNKWYYSCPTTIELILDCETRTLYLKFCDGKELDMKLKRWNALRLFIKLTSNVRGWSDRPITVRVGLVEANKMY